METIVGIAGGIFIGGGAVWLIAKFKAAADRATLEAQLESANQQIEVAKDECATLQKQAVEKGNECAGLQVSLDAANKRLSEQTDIERTLLDQFKVMASEVLSNNNEVFLQTADEKIGSLVKQAKSDFSLGKDAVQELVRPLADELKRIENARTESQGSLKQQIEDLAKGSRELIDETRNLSTALKRPEVRGTWGEIQLRRVVELAGMSEHCDYKEQVNITSEDGSRDRPDMVVYMPNQRTIVVDAKTPLNAYLKAVESNNEQEREEALQQHALQVKERAENLAKKSYQQKLDGSPDFVVMFLPGEFLLQSALEKDSELLDRVMRQNVVIATPNTLMALLKAVAMGWREAQLAEKANQIGELGQELHDRLETFAVHMVNMRAALTKTVECFNGGVGSLESRVLVQARRFKELGISSTQEIPELSEVTTRARDFRSAQLQMPPNSEGTDDD